MCGDQLRHFSGYFLIAPSPLQGTSQMIRSKKPPGPGNLCALCCVTARRAHLWPSTERRRASTCARSAESSLATTMPPSPRRPSASEAILSKACIVLEPGAAQRSNTRCSGCTPRTATGTALTISCLEMMPSAERRGRREARRARAEPGASFCSCRIVFESHASATALANSKVRGGGTKRPRAVVQPLSASSVSSASSSALPVPPPVVPEPPALQKRKATGSGCRSECLSFSHSASVSTSLWSR
mmetsp:Transcript_9545/g.29702  ORF Transcript_9545/g.29702 Transcript_9545/m.29702 type:complete len:244 (+) Transcript_9545:817-1548(+)